ncbi:MAG: hypothetical protein OK457_02335 [Thaumarchaeota archaeon]|nr:hypothetical protein [Nitrososphaerota archaeon]
MASHLPSFTFHISSLDPRLNPGSRWGISVVPGLLYDFVLKLPLIASDALVAVFTYRIAVRIFRDKNSAAIASALWFLNPLVIWVSSGWGMFDTLPTLFTVLALYFSLKGKFSLAALMLVLSALMKFYAIVLFVPFFILVWRKSGVRGLVLPLITTTVSLSVSAIPLFFISSPLSYVTASSPSAEFQYAGLSIWTLFSTIFSNANFSLISEILIVLGMTLTYLVIFRSRSPLHDSVTTVCFFLIPIIVLLMFYKFVGENYFVWMIPFSSIIAVNIKRINRAHWSISLVAFISSITDSLLPYYMLPVSPWIGGFLIAVLGLVASDRVAPNGTGIQGITFGKIFLSTLGIISFGILVLMLITTVSLVREGRNRKVENLANVVPS